MFITLTAWAGDIDPSQALAEYRRGSGTAAAGDGRNGRELFTIADPNDPGQLDVVGFDPRRRS